MESNRYLGMYGGMEGNLSGKLQRDIGPPPMTDQIGSLERVQWYSSIMEIPSDVGAVATTDIQITQQKFKSFMILWDQTYPCAQNEEQEPQIQPCLIANRDGLFTFEFRTSSRIYSNVAALIRSVVGDPVDGRPIPFPKVLILEPKETIVLKITNLIDRTGVDAMWRKLHITFLGVNLFGDARAAQE